MGLFRRGSIYFVRALYTVGRQTSSGAVNQSSALVDPHTLLQTIAREFSTRSISALRPGTGFCFSALEGSQRHFQSESKPTSVQQIHTDALSDYEPVVNEKVAAAQQVLKTISLSDARKLLELESATRADMEYSEFIQWCLDNKLANSECYAEALLSQMVKAGVLLTYQERVYLRPEEIAHSIIESLTALHPNNETVQRLAEQMRHLEHMHSTIEQEAYRQTNNVLWGTFFIMATQFTVFFYMTFTEPGWDVMEPVTFFWFYFTGLLCYLYFLLTRKEFTWENFRADMAQKLKEKHAINSNFDYSEYERLASRLRRHSNILSKFKR